jgi:hypothetical protein
MLKQDTEVRRRIYENMATLTHRSAQDMGKERAKKYKLRYLEGIYREIEQNGRTVWWDGVSQEKRKAGFHFEFDPLPERVDVDITMPIRVRLLDAQGRPVLPPEFKGTVNLSALPDTVQVEGLRPTDLQAGVATFAVTFKSLSEDVILRGGSPELPDKACVSRPMRVTEKARSPAEIERDLPYLADRVTICEQLTTGPARNAEMIYVGGELDRCINSVAGVTGYDKLLGELKRLRDRIGPLPEAK